MRRNRSDLHFGGARQFPLLDIMLWSLMGCLVESCGAWLGKTVGGMCPSPSAEVVRWDLHMLVGCFAFCSETEISLRSRSRLCSLALCLSAASFPSLSTLVC